MTDDERVRLFVALELPHRVQEELARWRSQVVDLVPGLRPVPAESLHVTLCFLGWRWGREVATIASACEAASAASAPRLHIVDALWLPRRRPRVLTVSLLDDSGRLSRVHALLSRELEAAGLYVVEKRPFLAHVTVARVGRGAGAGRDARAQTGAGDRDGKDARAGGRPLPDPPRLDFVGSTITLFRSHLSSRGSRYEALARVVLVG